jgi:DNA (cytosine-5)-methyltransferase 1
MDQGGSVMNVMQDGTVGTLRRETHGHKPSILQNMAVRRLTPVECERLQGFPDGYTAVPWRKKAAEDCPDGPRYKALGNSWAVPVVKWLGSRIETQC